MAETPTWSTTAFGRFVDALAVLVGNEPPPAYVGEWLAGREVNGAWRLQDWVAQHLPARLGWAQAIVVIDAALILAQTPEEGEPHEPWPGLEG